MNASYKIKLNENQKSVTTEITVENDDKEKAMKEAKEIFEAMSEYAHTKTLQKTL